MHYDAIIDSAREFVPGLKGVKAETPTPDFTWYGYDILANIWHVDPLLRGERRNLFSNIGGPIADIGAADGDLAYFFASLGMDVDILDWPATNWNGLRGARLLKDVLESDVGIHEIDLDSQFVLPRDRYGLVCLLGILYHLKNPFYVLEHLAKASRYCLLSTRVASRTRDGKVRLEDAPLAYLLSPDECNNDATNYWIFSVPGLLRLVERTGWSVVAWHTVGDRRRSDPSSPEHDERAFMVLESRVLAA